MIRIPTSYVRGMLRGVHVDFKNDTTALIAVWMSGIIAEEVLFSTPVRCGFL